MKSPVFRAAMGALALLSLAACLALGVLIFLGQVSEASYKGAFLAASVLWFVFSIARGKPAKGPSGVDVPGDGAGVV
jgi:hypothetical protein